MSVVIPPESLRKQLGDEVARDVVETMSSVAATMHEHTVQLVGERLERRLVETKTDLEKQILQVKSELENKIVQVKSDLENKIVQFKSELEKQIVQLGTALTWRMFAFWLAGVIPVLIAILLR